MKDRIINFIKKAERGQAIILIAFAFVGLVAMVGLVTDTGIVLIEYGKLKRSVDAAAVGAAQQYRQASGSDEINAEALENTALNFLHLNQINNVSNIVVRSCEEPIATNRPALCNPDPVNNPIDNRKLVQVTASANVTLGFLRVIGLQSITLTATSVGEAATIDLVLIVDTSASMAYETGNESNCNDPGGGTCTKSDSDDDPSVCNLNNTCEPMASVKEVALDFIDTMYFPYDRVAIVVMTSQEQDGGRYPDPFEPILHLSSDKDEITDTINNIKVFQPRVCDGTATEGDCLYYEGGIFRDQRCQILQIVADEDLDPSSCPSSNIGGTLRMAREELADPTAQRLDAFWVVVGLFGGPANATDPDAANGFPNGYCPMNTWFVAVRCRDPYPSVRHSDSATTSFTHPYTNDFYPAISIYDADDYARDQADNLATLTTGNGVTIYTIGLGAPIQKEAVEADGITPIPGEPAPAEDLLEYIAEEAGGPDINHGQYFYAETVTSLSNIFDRIAQNIATKISQ